ncbi:hypothetical protein GUITHDRAFT_112382 [Guillardia theta CCMP2712]|uniref:RWP-RK domain-containing protein n=1 Tax=Guillardia theta (strain CCMP2712) TaxID=905079 RepID=L1J0Q4_GUITC|nr:hypothetical protein GUITHDRAFT_112382 [Guillardia theta CCMP2712]EKX41675.1 hypothetical protein GUITHDRAFT_112382 [Guillardia theta CCMP2712]|eukprot:XP_005828655.1 hypothetical protein GUITHDRAFT_112382 [Guillardia theta CCMP2712]
MGICITAIKKVCRKLGIHKWPYRDLKERKNAAGKSLSEGGPSVPLETLSEASEYARLRGGAAGEESDSKDSDPQEAQSDQDSKLNTLCIAALELSQSDTKQGGQRRVVKSERSQGKSNFKQTVANTQRHRETSGKASAGDDRANEGSSSSSRNVAIASSDRNSERIEVSKLLG